MGRFRFQPLLTNGQKSSKFKNDKSTIYKTTPNDWTL